MSWSLSPRIALDDDIGFYLYANGVSRDPISLDWTETEGKHCLKAVPPILGFDKELLKLNLYPNNVTYRVVNPTFPFRSSMRLSAAAAEGNRLSLFIAFETEKSFPQAGRFQVRTIIGWAIG